MTVAKICPQSDGQSTFLYKTSVALDLWLVRDRAIDEKHRQILSIASFAVCVHYFRTLATTITVIWLVEPNVFVFEGIDNNLGTYMTLNYIIIMNKEVLGRSQLIYVF